MELNWSDLGFFVFNRKVQVMHDKCLSEPKPLFPGVAQESILGPLFFIIFFNCIVQELNQSKIIKYADDIVIVFADKDSNKVERTLCSNMNRSSEWFTEKELLLNLKPCKTELLVFGTNQRVAKIPKNLEVTYSHQVINVTTSYKYLGVELTSSLNLNSQFNGNYKKVSSRLKTPHRIRHLLINKLAKDVFSLMVLLSLSYCSLLKQSFSNTQVKKLRSLERRSKSLINIFDPNIKNLLKKRVCFYVYNVINEKIFPPLNNFYGLKVSKINTRNNGYMVKLPKTKREFDH